MLVFFLPACKNKEEVYAGKPASVLNRIQQAGTFKELLKCYSINTRKTITSLLRDGFLSDEQAFETLRIVDENSSWEIVTEKSSGKNAILVMVFTRHRIENRTGQQMKLHLERNGENWCIDMEGDLQLIKQMRGKVNPEGYLRKKLQNYQ